MTPGGRSRPRSPRGAVGEHVPALVAQTHGDSARTSGEPAGLVPKRPLGSGRKSRFDGLRSAYPIRAPRALRRGLAGAIMSIMDSHDERENNAGEVRSDEGPGKAAPDEPGLHGGNGEGRGLHCKCRFRPTREGSLAAATVLAAIFVWVGFGWLIWGSLAKDAASRCGESFPLWVASWGIPLVAIAAVVHAWCKVRSGSRIASPTHGWFTFAEHLIHPGLTLAAVLAVAVGFADKGIREARTSSLAAATDRRETGLVRHRRRIPLSFSEDCLGW